MTRDAILIVKFLFDTGWAFFTSFTIPGTNVTPAEWGFFGLFVMVALKIARSYFTSLDDGGDED